MTATSFDTALSGDTRHAAVAARAERLLQRYLAWPFAALIGFEVLCKSVLLVASVIEVPLLESTLAVVFPSAGELMVTAGAVAFLVVYVSLWDVLGVRLAEHRGVLSATRGSGRGPGSGTTAMFAALVAALLSVAVLRTHSLADSAARRAAATALAGSAQPLEAGAVARIEREAWWAAFWPDATFTVTVMAMLALLALLVGYYSPTRHQALSMHLSRFSADRATRAAADARAAYLDSERRAHAQRVVAAERAAHADALSAALEDRFARAGQLARHLIAQRQADPAATTTVFPCPEQQR